MPRFSSDVGNEIAAFLQTVSDFPQADAFKDWLKKAGDFLPDYLGLDNHLQWRYILFASMK